MSRTTDTNQTGFEVNSSFIGEFKSGDNIVYNLAILQVLYDACDLTPNGPGTPCPAHEAPRISNRLCGRGCVGGSCFADPPTHP
jgi:hypothetical protein